MALKPRYFIALTARFPTITEPQLVHNHLLFLIPVIIVNHFQYFVIYPLNCYLIPHSKPTFLPHSYSQHDVETHSIRPLQSDGDSAGLSQYYHMFCTLPPVRSPQGWRTGHHWYSVTAQQISLLLLTPCSSPPPIRRSGRLLPNSPHTRSPRDS